MLRRSSALKDGYSGGDRRPSGGRVLGLDGAGHTAAPDAMIALPAISHAGVRVTRRKSAVRRLILIIRTGDQHQRLGAKDAGACACFQEGNTLIGRSVQIVSGGGERAPVNLYTRARRSVPDADVKTA
ncbi:MAG: hypothetical protein WKF84_20340 [Pyrinomonadaceae bacterium]